MNMLDKMPLNKKMGIGFGLILFLLLVMGLAGVISLQTTSTRVSDVARKTENTTVVAAIQSDLVQTRRTAARYYSTSTDENETEVWDFHTKTSDNLAIAQESIKNAERAKVIDEVDAGVQTYSEGFGIVVEQTKLRDQYYNELAVVGGAMEEELFRFLESANKDNSTRAAYQSSLVMRQLLLGRMNVVKYYAETKDEYKQAAIKAMENVKAELDTLEVQTRNAERKAMLPDLKQYQADYVTSMTGLFSAIQARIDAKKEKMDQIGSLAAEFDAVKDEYSTELNEAMKEISVANQRANALMIILGVIAILIGVTMAVLISKGISLSIKTLEQAAATMSKGDFTVAIEPSTVKDEIGSMTNAFIIMKKNIQNLISTVIDSANNVASSSEELSAGADETSRGVQQVAQAVNEIAMGAQSTVENMNTVRDNMEQNARAVENVNRDVEEVAAYATEAADQGERGQQNAEQAMEIINRAAGSVQETASVVQSLGQKTGQISEFISIITGIADQTNLLALNAAIEAARAGEAGRGFAVVAEEVRKLAEESNQAAGSITDLVKGIEVEMQSALSAMERSDKEVASGAETVGLAGKMLVDMASGIRSLNDKVQSISAATEEITAGSNEVMKRVTDAASAAEEAASAAEEVSASTEEQTSAMEEIGANSNQLASLSQDLQQLVSKFTV